METYQKIQTIFLRDPETKFKKISEGQFAKPEFEYLANNQWRFTEKIDGTNIRILFDGETVEYRGKTDSAETPRELLEHLSAKFPFAKLKEIFPDASNLCLYGEGYGPGIQKYGASYRPDKGFILFDCLINGLWLEQENLANIAVKLECPLVPVLQTGTLYEALELARSGYKSVTAQNPDLVAEGLIMKPLIELRNRRGERIITKIKFRDFK